MAQRAPSCRACESLADAHGWGARDAEVRRGLSVGPTGTAKRSTTSGYGDGGGKRRRRGRKKRSAGQRLRAACGSSCVGLVLGLLVNRSSALTGARQPRAQCYTPARGVPERAAVGRRAVRGRRPVRSEEVRATTARAAYCSRSRSAGNSGPLWVSSGVLDDLGSSIVNHRLDRQ